MRKRSYYLVGLLVAIVMALLVIQTPLLSSARDVAWSSWVSIIGARFNVGSLTVEANVAEQLDQLVAENARLKSESLELRLLRAQLGSLAFDDYKVLLAEVVARPVDIFHTEYVINRGALDGVIIGAPVVIYGSTLVGTVTNLHRRSAIVRLLAHTDTNLPVEVILEDTLERGLVKGRAYTGVELTTITRDVPLQAGQSVVTADQGFEIPAGLFIGTVTDIDTNEHEVYQRARLELPYNPDSLRAVAVLVAP